MAEAGADHATIASGCGPCARSTIWSRRWSGALDETGRLDDTYVVYTSDNGFHMGQHRLFIGKTTAYEEDIRVPMACAGPGVPAGQRLAQMVLNNDLAPTFAAIAGVEPPSFVDGRSFLELLTKPETPWRRSFLIERRQMETHELAGNAIIDGIRTARHTYVEYGTGERELYDLENDPFQPKNIAGTADPALLQAFAARLAELKNCAVDQLPDARGLAGRARADARGGAWHACEGLTSPRRPPTRR